MESLIETSTLVWRGVSPVASGGPSGSSLTWRLLSWAGVMDRTVRPRAPPNQTRVRTGVSPSTDGPVVSNALPAPARRRRPGVPGQATLVGGPMAHGPGCPGPMDEGPGPTGHGDHRPRGPAATAARTRVRSVGRGVDP